MDRISVSTRFRTTTRCTAFLISLATLLSSLLPRQSWFMNNNDNAIVQPPSEPIITIETDGIASGDNHNNYIVPEKEDLVQVNTVPTQRGTWKPKRFDDPDMAIQKAIDRNVRKENRNFTCRTTR